MIKISFLWQILLPCLEESTIEAMIMNLSISLESIMESTVKPITVEQKSLKKKKKKKQTLDSLPKVVLDNRNNP